MGGSTTSTVLRMLDSSHGLSAMNLFHSLIHTCTNARALPSPLKRPPLAFTLVGANDKVLIVRGSKTGGMAIFRKIKQDMRPAAYGFTKR